MIPTVARDIMQPGERVEAALRERIAAGEWAPGQAMPTVAALAAEYGTSGATVSKALHRLAADGLVIVRPRWGVFRAPAK